MAKKKGGGGMFFLLAFAAAIAAIWVWSKVGPKGDPMIDPKTGGVRLPEGTFYGPNVDATTGAYLPPGTAPGTTQFNSQPVGLQ